ncbi:hypothetical protein DFH09DRAFT_1285314 [Mycena vulgaris]|nr:hypothetical protein DFH09DRAFT_1285314 [Mycena vulgaris]
MDAGAYDDVDAEGELDVLDGGGMTLVSAGGLETLGLAAPAATTLAAGAGVGKRYRPAPAKTFQCRGFGECRMVFSRSEHLARHVRKHTGERPFTCHCSKQFSRLDNLRQHAQTVHADKADLNEAMMRELTSLHASMSGTPSATTTTTATTSSSTTSSTTTAAGAGAGAGTASPTTPTSASGGAGKRGGAATKRARGGGSAAGVAAHGGGGGAAVKREPVELGLGLDLVRPRPGTSTGYEGAAGPGYVDESAPGYMDVDRDEQPPRPPQPSPPPSGGGARSFRGPAPFPPAYGQSFLAAHAYSNGGANGGGGGPNGGANGGAYNTHTHSGGSGQSFRGHPFARRSPPEHTPSPPIPSVNGNANGITPHRITSGGAFSNGSAFQSTGRPFSSGNNSFSPNTDGFPSSGAFPASTFPSNGGPPFSSSSGSRPSTGNGARLPPLSSVVSASAFRPSSGHGLPTAGGAGSILLPGSLTLRRPSTGGDWDWDAPWSARPGTAPGKLAAAAAAPVDDSPFSFHPPEQSSPFAFGGGGIGNPRKRAFGSTDGPHGAHPDDGSGGGGGYEYEYGSDSRPASRRLSVMELCNDDAGERRPASAVGVPLLRGGSAERERERERPTTTNGLVSRASALVLHDRDQQWEREHEPRQHASEQHVTADRGAGLVRVHGSRSRAGSHQAGQLHSALEESRAQAQADAEMVAYQQQQREAHFFHQQQQAQQQEQERRIEEERYHLQQMHHQQYLDSYAAHPHPQEMGMGMDMGSMAGMEMYHGAHMGGMGALDMEAPPGGDYLAHHLPHPSQHTEAAGSPVLGYPADSAEYHPHHLEAAQTGGSPTVPYSLAYPHTPLGYPYAETMHSGGYIGGGPATAEYSATPGFAMRPEDALKFETSLGLDTDLGLLDMSMSMPMHIGMGVGGAAG